MKIKEIEACDATRFGNSGLNNNQASSIHQYLAHFVICYCKTLLWTTIFTILWDVYYFYKSEHSEICVLSMLEIKWKSSSLRSN